MFLPYGAIIVSENGYWKPKVVSWSNCKTWKNLEGMAASRYYQVSRKADKKVSEEEIESKENARNKMEFRMAL